MENYSAIVAAAAMSKNYQGKFVEVHKRKDGSSVYFGAYRVMRIDADRIRFDDHGSYDIKLVKLIAKLVEAFAPEYTLVGQPGHLSLNRKDGCMFQWNGQASFDKDGNLLVV